MASAAKSAAKAGDIMLVWDDVLLLQNDKNAVIMLIMYES
jgi:hypothetical protein